MHLALSVGDPAGIGPEIIRAAVPVFLAENPGAKVTVFGDQDSFPGLNVHPLSLGIRPILGQPDGANAAYTIASIEAGVAAVLDGHADALVTAPISKDVLYGAGFAFPGHTEFLGHLAGRAAGGTPGSMLGDLPTHMMLASDDLRVVPVTLHQSLASAIADLSEAKILAAARATHDALHARFGIQNPRLAVCGLNPHAGENGAMGQEDLRIIAPAVAALRAAGMDVRGPLPADTLFHAAARQTYDAVLGMYHDQVLIPIKALAFDTAVNLTLGLPFIRTSPDHGTAFDIAGRGVARADSFLSALNLAARLA